MHLDQKVISGAQKRKKRAAYCCHPAGRDYGVFCALDSCELAGKHLLTWVALHVLWL
jgi:hypothetical protein